MSLSGFVFWHFSLVIFSHAKTRVVVQVTGKSLSSLTSMSFPLSGGNLSQFYCIHTPKLLKPNNQPVNQPVEKNIYFSQLTAVHRASLSPTSSLDNILFTVDGSAVSFLPR